MPISNDPPTPQKHTPQTSLETSQTSLPSSSMEQTKTQQLPQDPSEKKYDENDQRGSKKTVPSTVIKHENPVDEVKGNETTE